MNVLSGHGGWNAYLPRLMARLTGLPANTASLWGVVALTGIALADSAARDLGFRLVPLYVPVLCVICWVIGHRRAILFSVAAALIANAPDIMASPEPLGLASVANTMMRMIAYVFLALIVTAYRCTYDEADLRAMYDGLTSVLNKMSFHASARQQIGVAQRSRQTLLVVYVDLDGFKAINTIYGHAAGDAALRAFAHEARSAIRGSDLVGRLGGDEFGFLVTANSDQHAEGLAHLLHQRLTTTLTKTGLPLSCSMGALILQPRRGTPEAELFGAADRLMREAKASGKNMVLTERMSEAVMAA